MFSLLNAHGGHVLGIARCFRVKYLPEVSERIAERLSHSWTMSEVSGFNEEPVSIWNHDPGH